MRAGRLDRRIDIQRKIVRQSDSGEPVETWSTIAGRRAASYRGLKAEERLQGPQIVSDDQVEFKVRWSSNLADLSPLDRIIYPALTEDESGFVGRRLYDILAVNELGRRDGLQIITNRRPDIFEIVEGEGMPLTWPAKDPDEDMDFQLDWLERLAGDTIATSTWTVPSGITSHDESNDDTTATIWLSGGTLGETYSLLNRVITAGGRTMDQTVTVEIVTQ